MVNRKTRATLFDFSFSTGEQVQQKSRLRRADFSTEDSNSIADREGEEFLKNGLTDRRVFQELID